jgi:hypothetical protein
MWVSLSVAPAHGSGEEATTAALTVEFVSADRWDWSARG